MMRTALCMTVLSWLAVPGAAWAQQTDPYYGPHMWGAWHGWFLGPIFMVLLLVGAIAVAVLLVRWLGPHHGPAGPAGRTPLDILKERFARGEIDKVEFEERRRVLGD